MIYPEWSYCNLSWLAKNTHPFIIEKFDQVLILIKLLSCLQLCTNVVAVAYCLYNLFPRDSYKSLLMEFGSDEQKDHMMHALGGMLIILFSNGLVIVGICCNIHFLLIPWLIIYVIGKGFFFVMLALCV